MTSRLPAEAEFTPTGAEDALLGLALPDLAMMAGASLADSRQGYDNIQDREAVAAGHAIPRPDGQAVLSGPLSVPQVSACSNWPPSARVGPSRHRPAIHLQCPLLTSLSLFLPSQSGTRAPQQPSPFQVDTTNDEFRMYSFKIDACPSLSDIHDWNECPYLHPGEKARRRDPRVWSYQALPCPEFRKGMCKRGDGCPFAHGVFECWLHPTRYRTTLCKEGGACHRPICFFAHSVAQLRDPTRPAPAAGSPGSAVTTPQLSLTQLPQLSSGSLSAGSSGADSRAASPSAVSTLLPSDGLSAMLVSDGEAAAVAAAVAVRAHQQQAAAAAQAHALVTRLLELERSVSGSLSLPSVAGSREVSLDSVDLDGAMGPREAAALRQLMGGLAL